MSSRAAPITQNTARGIFKAAKDAGYVSATITVHPDGRIVAFASNAENSQTANSENAWDDVLK
jgi:hypothetical protein